MTYRSILLNMDIDGPAATLVDLAIDLAARFEARLIGFSAAEARLPVIGPEGGTIAADLWQQEREDIVKTLSERRAEFEARAGGSVAVGWRDAVGDPTRSLARIARVADLVVTTAKGGASTGDAYRVVDPGSLVLQAGRPLLVVADGAARVAARNVVIAWKDTREARRAVADALPLLRGADGVAVVTVDREPDDSIRAGVADVASYLERHGVRARTEILAARDEQTRLAEFIDACGADLVVSGAFGHSRLREWAFGGVTRSLLDQPGLNRLMSS